MAALVRYTFARCLVSQHWMPPVLLFVFVVGFLYPTSSGTLGGSGAVGGIMLVPVTAWLAIAAINTEDLSQRGVMATAAGGYRMARVGVVLAAATCGAMLAALSLVVALVRDPEVWTPSTFESAHVGETIVLAVVAQFAGAAFGAAFGGLVAKPVIRRAGFAWLAVVIITLLALLIPGSPFRSLVAILGTRSQAESVTDWLGFGAALGAAIILSAGVFLAGLALARRQE